MDNLDDSENNAKVSDSAYSTSCSNSQSRRSRSSKSTHSGSHSSGSSGYGGKPSHYSDGSGQQAEKRSKEKEIKKKKQVQSEQTFEVELEEEAGPAELAPIAEAKETTEIVDYKPPAQQTQAEIGTETLESTPPERSSSDDLVAISSPVLTSEPDIIDHDTQESPNGDGFSCIISVHDSAVMHSSPSLTTTLGFPKDVWTGRSFMDFVHPKDRGTFASHVTNDCAASKKVNGTIKNTALATNSSVCTMVCRIRKYRCLTQGFGVKERPCIYKPFHLKLSFKKASDEEGKCTEGKCTFLIIQATPFCSAFTTPNEVITNAKPFEIRHTADGTVMFVDPDSAAYLGFLPQDLNGKDALLLYHPEDLPYLRTVYEILVNRGSLPRSKPFRIITQNKDYIMVETEWSSFTNPWSKKLELVLAKHHIIKGPSNPDVFQAPVNEKSQKIIDEETMKTSGIRESIIRILNEVPSKPAESAKQQMSRKCQDLACFMETLIEDQPKADDELQVEIQDNDNSNERDSFMLGGISPHHEYNDSQSSTETLLSYNQLNYNQTLQRFFDSHEPYLSEDNNTGNGEIIPSHNTNNTNENSDHSMSSVQHSFLESTDISSADSYGNSSSIAIDFYSPARLTESTIQKHNSEMEKELKKTHAKLRVATKSEREKIENETRQRQKEHLARCNASYQPTSVCNFSEPQELMKKPREPTTRKRKQQRRQNRLEEQSFVAGASNVEKSQQQSHGVKRPSKNTDALAAVQPKHQCTATRQSRRKHSTNFAPAHPSTTVTNTVAGSNWPGVAINNMNTFFVGVGFPPNIPIVSPIGGLTGIIPMYYTQPGPSMPSTSNRCSQSSSNNTNQYQPLPCTMYGQAMYGSPFIYSPMNGPAVSYPVQNTVNFSPQTVHTTMVYPHPLKLNHNNYEEACKQGPSRDKTDANSVWREKQLRKQLGVHLSGGMRNFCSSPSLQDGGRSSDSLTDQTKMDLSGLGSSDNSVGIMSTQAMPDSLTSRCAKKSEEITDRTDGESTYSSFYSSFFKTDSGSADDSDARKTMLDSDDATGMRTTNTYYTPLNTKRTIRRKLDPPWTEQVCVTSELVYKYQIVSKSVEEVLKADKIKLQTLEQPAMVNEQLEQLYLDLQLEGVAAKLTLEEGITSSSSSGEETSPTLRRTRTKKYQYSKLMMIYEEDAPLPPPSDDDSSPPPLFTSGI